MELDRYVILKASILFCVAFAQHSNDEDLTTASSQSTTEVTPKTHDVTAVCRNRFPEGRNVWGIYVRGSGRCEYSCMDDFNLISSHKMKDDTNCGTKESCLGGNCRSDDDIESCRRVSGGRIAYILSEPCRIICFLASEYRDEITVYRDEGKRCLTSEWGWDGFCESGTCYRDYYRPWDRYKRDSTLK